VADLESLWQPLTIGSTTVRNRIMTTALSVAYGELNILSDRHVAYYEERAKGGAALLITEQHAAHRLSKGSFFQCCTAWEKRCIPQLEKLADAVHAHGAKQFVQLFAAGVHDKGTMFDPWHPLWAASRVPSVVHNEIPYVMEQDDIDDVIKGYAESARNVEISGLDGVEIHGAHSYLVAQFLSPFYNRRSDRYGGSVRSRCQFAIEIAEAIRAATQPSFTIGMRLSFDEFVGDAGITAEQTDEQLEVFASTGLFDFFNISGGNYYTFHRLFGTMGMQEDGFLIPYGKRAKQIVGDRAKIFIVGRIRDVELAAQAVADGATDMVAMTRAHLADPHLVNKARSGRTEEIIKCVGANECVLRNFQQRDVFCLVNPVTGREAQWGEGLLDRVDERSRKRIVVVGGGPAGLKFAEVAAARGHGVILVERENELGGHINLLKRLPTRSEWQIAIDNLVGGVERGGVDVRLGVLATKELLAKDAPDAVVCATGSSWDRTGFSASRPDRDTMPGVEQPNVLDVGTATERALADPGCLGGKVLIVDETGEYLPLGLAEVLAAAGAAVEIITWRTVVGENIIGNLEAGAVFPRLKANGVKMHGHRFVERIEGTSVELYDIWGGDSWTIEADTVVLSMLRSPEAGLFLDIRGSFAEAVRIGDALAPRRTIVSIYEGEELGRRI
jgi:2,4-dienoyl-CoA reductase-like NADH-dependent reductase (Old Yellow Enzyme family)